MLTTLPPPRPPTPHSPLTVPVINLTKACQLVLIMNQVEAYSLILICTWSGVTQEGSQAPMITEPHLYTYQGSRDNGSEHVSLGLEPFPSRLDTLTTTVHSVKTPAHGCVCSMCWLVFTRIRAVWVSCDPCLALFPKAVWRPGNEAGILLERSEVTLIVSRP